MTPRPTQLMDGMRLMNAPITKDQFTFKLGNMSYVDYSYDEPTATVASTPKHGVGHWFVRAMGAVAQWRRRQTVMRELEMLTEHELADIGLTRADLPRVFDPAFAAEHAGGRDYIAY
jgi:uncharacterized protein YjiS (DUF1127 family)